MGPALFIVLGSGCLVLQGARLCTPQRGGICGGAGVRDDASIVPYRGLLYRGGCGFPVRRGPAVGRRGGIYPSRGCSRRRGVRRDEGIPPYGRFIGSAYTGKAACFRREECHVGADSISARGVCGVAGSPGRCEHRPLQGFAIKQGSHFPVRRGPAVVRRGGIYPSRGCLRRRRVRRDEGIPPYGRFMGSAYTGKAACFRREERHVGADSISARGVRGGAGRADMESAPTGVCYRTGFTVSRLAAGLVSTPNSKNSEL